MSKSKTDFNGKTTKYAYDPSNRLLSKTPDASFNAPPVAFTYTLNGLRLTMSDVSGQSTYGYDTRNRLTSKQTPFGTLSYTYDNAGDVATIASSNTNGASLTYAYDALNRLATVTDNRLVAQGSTSGVTHYSYDPVGNLSGYTYPNGVQTSYSYDALNRLTQMGSAKSGALSSYAYTLGAAGNRLTVAELSGRNVAYGYDALYRLTSEAVTADPHNHNVTNGYLYDAVGNRQQWLVNGATVNTYTYDADDRLGADQYDANGNTVLSTGISDSYDFENHLVQKGAVTVVYDGDGNRVAETAGEVTTNYLVDTNNPTGYVQVVDELVSGTVTRTYAYGLERISENQIISSAWTPSFYGYDGHGSVRQLTNSAGAVTDTYDYDAFGNLINSTGSTPNNYLFAGEQYDPALSLYYNRARYLNTATGRFWSMDTYEGTTFDPTSLHKYLYTGGDPIDRADPSGNDSLEDVMFALAISTVLLTMSCTQDHGPKLVTVTRYAYEEIEYGVHIVLGAMTQGRLPNYPEYRWVQTVTTNAIQPQAKGFAQADVPFNDPQPPDDNKPYFWTDRELPAHQHQYGYDLIFEDRPARAPSNYPKIRGDIYWKASLDLVGVSPAGSVTYSPIVHITYGFTVRQNGTQTEDDLQINRE